MAAVNAIITSVFNNPTPTAVGLVAGFILAKAMDKRKRRSGFGGGGGMF